ncbi:MAG: S8 family serine peptidase [Gemmobacter sp.]
MTPTDPLYSQQWHFPLVGNIGRIWDDYHGTGVTVGVFDGGVQVGHADLAANYNAGLHFVYNGVTYLPTPMGPDDGHGTAVAGIVAAVDSNGTGGAGVAHGVQLTAINRFDPALYATPEITEAVIRWGAQFDIMSNSWNWDVFYNDFEDIGDDGTDHDNYDRWFQANAETGRGGLGTINVMGAGNETANANGSGVNVSRFTITVAATESDGFVADYSNYGASILITAPAAAVTTDLAGEAGYNTSGDNDPLALNYTSVFGGTSAATPVVSGVVALMLDAAPGLGWRDVSTILALSAGHTGSAYGAAVTGPEFEPWETTGATDWNGGGRAFNIHYGYGMVDAFAAVRMAEAWSRMSGQAQTSANEVTVTAGYNGPAVSIPDWTGGTFGVASAAVNVTTDIEVETVYVTLSITHPRSSDIGLTLRAPDGTEISIFHYEGGEDLFDGTFEYTFAVEALRGYSSVGQWQLVAYDVVGGLTGTLLDFDLQFFGRAASVNDIHTFTDDFLALAAIEPDRRTFGDTNGGTDWLNFAGVSGAMSGRLGGGYDILVNGVVWAQEIGDNIENYHLGSGNDSLLGGRGNNTMIGHYGNDKLNGFRGNDTVEGGLGNDRVNGGIGNDLLDGGLGVDEMTGGDGTDTFVFGAGYRRDIITDFTDNVDTIQISRDLWRANLTLSVAQLIDRFATVVGTDVVFDFGVNELTVRFASAPGTSIFLDDIVIV